MSSGCFGLLQAASSSNFLQASALLENAGCSSLLELFTFLKGCCFLLQVALKCSDLSHLACTPEVHGQWVGKLSEEFFQQGDQEQALGLPISPLMDRTKTTECMAKSQVVIPSCAHLKAMHP